MKNLMRGKYSGLIILLGLFLLLLGTGKPANAAMVGYWKFDEGEGTTASDSAGTNHGTIYGPQWVDGHEGNALDFDGVDDYVNLSNPSSLQPSGAYTISAWVYREGDGAGVFNGIATTAKKTGTTDRGCNGYSLLYYPGGKVVRLYHDEDGAGDWKYAESNGDLALNTWYYLTAVWENPTITLYINGIAQTTTGSANKITYHANTESAIGQYWWNGAEGFFSGIIDEVAIYDHALSAPEVWELYQSGVPTPPGYFEAGEALLKNDALYLNSNGKVYKTDADDWAKMPAIGLACKNAPEPGDLIELETVSGKVVTGFPFDSEDIGKAVYVDKETPGQLIVGPPTEAYVQKMGIVKTSEQLLLTIDVAALPKQSAVFAHADGGRQILPVGVHNVVRFNVVTYDKQEDEYDPSTHRFTAKEAGIYSVKSIVCLSPTASVTYFWLQIYKNGGQLIAVVGIPRALGLGESYMIVGDVSLEAGEYIEIRLFPPEIPLEVAPYGSATTLSIHKID